MRGVGRIVSNGIVRYQMVLARRVLEHDIYTIRAIAGSRTGACWLPALSKTYRNLSFLPVASWTPGKKTNVCNVVISRMTNQSPVLPLNRTALWTLSYRLTMTRMMLALMLQILLVAHKASCHTLSKAFLKSMKTW